MFVKHIKGNVKEGVDYPLGIRTLIVGDNGTGKSSIINAIELALGGFASDVNGRGTVKKSSDLITLKNTDKNDKSKTLHATATLDNDGVCHWEVKKTPKGAGRPSHAIPKGFTVRFPFQEVKANLTGSADTARQYLLSLLPIEEYMSYKPENVTRELEAQKQAKPTVSVGDHLQTVVEIAKRRMKDAKAEIKARGISKDLLGKGLVPTTEEAVEEARKRSDLALSRIMEQKNFVDEDTVERARMRAIKLVEELVDMEQALEKEKPEPITSEEETHKYILGAMAEVIKIHAERGDTSCLVCGGSLENVVTAEAIEEILLPIRQREQHLIIYNDLKARTEVKRAQAEAAAQSYNDLDGSERRKSDDDLNTEYAQARKEYETLKENWAKQVQLRELEEGLQRNQEILKEAEKLKHDAELAAQDALTQAIDAFEDKVAAFLPKGRKFVLDLGKTFCRIGLSKYGQIRYAVSGAEYNMLVLAIAAATSVDRGDAFNVFIPEERAYDAHTLSEMLDALKNVNGQVLITTTSLPKEPHPDWGLVQTTSIPF